MTFAVGSKFWVSGSGFVYMRLLILIAHNLPIIMLGGWGAESSQVANNDVGMGVGWGCSEQRARGRTEKEQRIRNSYFQLETLH
jgi:hypothetical protein